MYLHTIAEPEASFTKEDMHAGKHTEFERKLHEDLATRTTVATQKRRVASGSEKAESKKEDEDVDGDEMVEEAETNVSEPETNSSEQENSVALDAECAALTSRADEPVQPPQCINVLQSLSQNTDDMRPVYSSHLRYSSTPSSPLPTFASLQQTHHQYTQQQSSVTNVRRLESFFESFKKF